MLSYSSVGVLGRSPLPLAFVSWIETNVDIYSSAHYPRVTKKLIVNKSWPTQRACYASTLEHPTNYTESLNLGKLKIHRAFLFSQ